MRQLIDGNELLLSRTRKFVERDRTTQTEQAGYVDAESQIKRLLYAGENLMNYKREFYDCPDGEWTDDILPDPTQALGFDPVDAQILMESIEKKAMRKKLNASRSADSEQSDGEPKNEAKLDGEHAGT